MRKSLRIRPPQLGIAVGIGGDLKKAAVLQEQPGVDIPADICNLPVLEKPGVFVEPEALFLLGPAGDLESTPPVLPSR